MGSPSNDMLGTSPSCHMAIGQIFSGFNLSTVDAQSHHPNRWQASQLWQVFLNNVDPIAKFLHIPTIQIMVFAAINNPDENPSDLEALLFAIYFTATTSMSCKDVKNLLDQDRDTALIQFKQGLEQSLAKANIMETPSLMSLQAMTLYVVRIFDKTK